MANSKYEYVRLFEQDETLLPNTWIVIRIDGRGFHKLSKHYSFAKPNDFRATSLMNAAATHTLRSIPDICFAYGVSDEYSFIFERDTKLFERRRDKLCSTVVSTFTAAFVFLWGDWFGGGVEGGGIKVQGGEGSEEGNSNDPSTDINTNTNPAHQSQLPSSVPTPLSPTALPTFDARAILYPSAANLRDYLSWRQVDCHINNLYNTTFWHLVLLGGMSERDAEELLKGTVSAEKNEILWGKFGVNYNRQQEWERKGSVVWRDFGVGGRERETGDERVRDEESKSGGGAGRGDGVGEARGAEEQVEEQERADAEKGGPYEEEARTYGQGTGDGGEQPNKHNTPIPNSKTQQAKLKKKKGKATIVVEHVDIIKDEFWNRRPWILGGKAGVGSA